MGKGKRPEGVNHGDYLRYPARTAARLLQEKFSGGGGKKADDRSTQNKGGRQTTSHWGKDLVIEA